MKLKNVSILVVDDEAHARGILCEFLSERGARMVEAKDGREALARLAGEKIDVVISDLQMPELDGLELLRNCRAHHPEIDFVLVTAHGSIESAVQAMKLGAAEYLLKPVDLDEVELRVGRLLEIKKLREKSEWMADEGRRQAGDGVVHESAVMRQLFADLDRVVKSDATVLLTGETGVGKEVVARRIHERSPRAKGPFVAINCGAIAENLLESQFFGHEKGAFTGADKRVAGCFEVADGGTLFLDELGEMDLKLQAKILRALEERIVVRLGSQTPLHVDVRVVAATNQSLQEMVAQKTFREDLYFRLKTIHFHLPPLRERKDDLGPLIQAFIARFAGVARASKIRIEPGFLQALAGYSFPGNVRELRNIIERALLFSNGDILSANALPADIRGGGPPLPRTNEVKMPATLVLGSSLAESVADFEKNLLMAALDASAGDVEESAKRLKISRSALYAKLAKYGVKQ